MAEAAARAGVPARLHLKADTGLSRGGATPADWPAVVQAALAAQAAGRLRVVGLWSHFACADLPGHPSIAAQLTAFADAVAQAEKAGVTPEVRHIANTAARADRAGVPAATSSGSAAPCTASPPCPAARRPGCARP